jgi:hypothetical protein
LNVTVLDPAVNVPEFLQCGDAEYAGGDLKETGYALSIKGSKKEEIWDKVVKIGGNRGYYYGNFLWKLRGTIDRILGGSGHKRGRRHPTEIRTGDALDFFRVMDVKAPVLLRLVVEMKIPGEALLEFHVLDGKDEAVELIMIAKYNPRGLLGLIYWYLIYPLHLLVFKGMLKTIAATLGEKDSKEDSKIYKVQSDICHIEKEP